MNSRAIPGAYLFHLYVCDKEMSWPHHIGETHQPNWVVYVWESKKFRLTNVIPERIIFVSWGITVYIYIYLYPCTYQPWLEHVGGFIITKLHHKTKVHLLVFNKFYINECLICWGNTHIPHQLNVWCVVHDVWCVVHDAWCVMCCAWCVVHVCLRRWNLSQLHKL